MKTIDLYAKNKKVGEAKVDDRDYDHLTQWKWHLHHDGYAIRRIKSHEKTFTVQMHRQLLGTPHDALADHVNGDRLDNRKSNLRIATHKENAMNRKVRRTSRTGIKGVGKYGPRHSWRASIRVDGKTLYLGSYKTARDAAAAYNAAAVKHHGQYARLNDLELVDEQEKLLLNSTSNSA